MVNYKWLYDHIFPYIKWHHKATFKLFSECISDYVHQISSRLTHELWPKIKFKGNPFLHWLLYFWIRPKLLILLFWSFNFGWQTPKYFYQNWPLWHAHNLAVCLSIYLCWPYLTYITDGSLLQLTFSWKCQAKTKACRKPSQVWKKWNGSCGMLKVERRRAK